jgi:RHS repeat-associated protein
LGLVSERMSFDAWGKRRAAERTDLDRILAVDAYNTTFTALELTSPTTNRGFTGHQQLDGVGIIHMGGRIYDADIGRFLQADPFVQDRTNLQALNRYSYVQNNPLSYTDPSGYFLKSLFKKLRSFIVKAIKFNLKPARAVLKAIARVPGLSTVISAVLNFIPFCQYWCSALFNASLAAAQGASFEDILTGAAIGAVTSYIGAQIGGGIGSATGVEVTKTAVQTSIASFTVAATGHAIAGGIAAKAQGGKFVDGFKYSALGAALTGAFKWASGDFKTAGVEVDQTDSSKSDSGTSLEDAKRTLIENDLVPEDILSNGDIFKDRTNEYGLIKGNEVIGVLDLESISALEKVGWGRIEGAASSGGTIQIFRGATSSGFEDHVGLSGRFLMGQQNLVQTIYHEYLHYNGVKSHGNVRGSFAWNRWARREGRALNPVFDR